MTPFLFQFCTEWLSIFVPNDPYFEHGQGTSLSLQIGSAPPQGKSEFLMKFTCSNFPFLSATLYSVFNLICISFRNAWELGLVEAY